MTERDRFQKTESVYSHPSISKGDWFQDTFLQAPTQIHGCLSPLYKMAQSLHITYAPVYFKSYQHYLQYLTQCKYGLPRWLNDRVCLTMDPGLGRSPGEGNDNPLHYSCLENSMEREAWWVTVHGAAKIRHNWATNTHTIFKIYFKIQLPI